MTVGRRLLAAFAGFALAASLCGPAAGTPADDLEQVRRQLERTRKAIERAEARERELRKDIASADARRRNLVDEIEWLGVELRGAQERFDAAQADLGSVQQQLAVKESELASTLEQLQAAHDGVKQRAVEVYMRGPARFLDFVVGSADFRELVSRVFFLGRVFRRDGDRIRAFEEAKARAIAERDAVAELRLQVAATFAVVASDRDKVAGVKARLDGRSRALAEEIKTKYATLEDVQEDKQAYLRQQRELQAESARIAAFLRSRTGGKASVGTGGMTWPVSGPVTSGYGWRTHPIFGTRRFHAGIDIAAPSGSSVRSGAAGTVLYAGPEGGYGTVVIVDHGGGLATLYAHLSSVVAGDGASVSAGQTVGRVGCSGYCTGPHLHFEVRVAGEPQNPMAWLS